MLFHDPDGNLMDFFKPVTPEAIKKGVVLSFTHFGMPSGIHRDQGLIAIKPSGVDYETMKPSDLVITDLAGRVVEVSLRPSSDLPAHVVLYQSFPTIGRTPKSNHAPVYLWQ